MLHIEFAYAVRHDLTHVSPTHLKTHKRQTALGVRCAATKLTQDTDSVTTKVDNQLGALAKFEPDLQRLLGFHWMLPIRL